MFDVVPLWLDSEIGFVFFRAAGTSWYLKHIEVVGRLCF